MTRLVFGLLWLAHFLPLRILSAIGNGVGTVLFWLIPERRYVARFNLERCFPDWPPERREQVARAHFRAFCRSLVERALLWWAPRERVVAAIRVEGLEHLRALGGAPAILLVPHFVGMDAAFTRLCIELDMVGMYANQKDEKLVELLARGRTRFGDQRTVSRQEGVRPLLSGMKEGRPLYYLPDQDYGARDAVFVPFFGVPAATITALARIARLTRAKVLPCVVRMLAPGEGYVVTIEPPWADYPSEDDVTDARRMNAYIETKVLEMPEQYLWMHRRFKSRPEGEAPFYQDQ